MTSKHARHILPILLILLFASTTSALPTTTHDTVRGEMYVSSTANWPSTYSTNNFDVPNGTVVFARYYVGIWTSGTPDSISTTFNGHAFETNPSYYVSGMGVTWIPYNVTNYVLPGKKNTATIDSSKWGDGRQYGSTLVIVLENESKPQIEYWVAEGLDWLHYGDYVGDEVDNSITYFNGTVNLADLQSASLYSTHLTGYNYEDFNGKYLSSPADSVSGDYFNYIRWDNVKPSLVAENQTVNVGRGSDTYCSPVFHALSIVYEKPDLVPVSLTPDTVVPKTSNIITATIENQGNKNSIAFNASLLVDGTVVDTKTVTSLTIENSTNVDFHWTPNGTANSYTLTVNVDPENEVNEGNESNNTLTALVGTTTAPIPVADFTTPSTAGDAPLTVNFTDQSTNSPTSWSWDFNNDGTTDSMLQNPIYIYSNPGTYTIKLTVTNAGGSNSTTKTDYITVNTPTVPVSNFTATPTSGDAPITVQFTDTSTNIPTSWLWDFGDGNNSIEQNPTHTYTSGRKYTVKLTATNAAGSNTTEKIDCITVMAAPVADFKATPTSGAVPLTVTFTDKSSNSPTSWLWNFGDGTISTEQNPTHTYIIGGRYTVKLTVTNIAGTNTTTKIGYIKVTATAATGPIWIAKSEWNAPKIGTYAVPCLVDFDEDGDYDLLIGEYNGKTYAYENTGTISSPVWTRKNTWDAPDIGSGAHPCLADLDGDEDYDLMVGAMNGITYAYENTGTASSPVWTAKSAWGISDIGDWASPCLADLDGDADSDLLIGSRKGITYAYENTGTESNPVWEAKSAWNVPDLSSSGSDFASPGLADLDGDGDYDLLIGERYGVSYGYENTETENSPVWTAKFMWNAPDVGLVACPYLADLDGDGDYDLLIGANDGITYAYENIAVSAIATPDLTPITVTPLSSIVNTPCIISATINNTGTGNVDAFNASLSINGKVVDSQVVSGITSGSCTSVNFSWTPESAGGYNLTVTADPENGISESDETNNALTIKVTASAASAPPVANFSADVTSGTASLTVNFTDESKGAPAKWAWDFENDGTVDSTEQNPSQTYEKAGNYTVNLTVSNADGSDSEIKMDYIVVSASETPDTTKPVIESVVLFPANTTAGSTINISANITDDVEVTEVTAGEIQLTKTDGIWQGSIIAPSSLGDYSLSINASDAAGNIAETSVPYRVVQLSGGANIAVSPRASSAAAGKIASLSIKVKNTQNIDDTFKVRISVSELPASYQANLSWFNWTEKVVTLKAGEEVLVPVEVTVPDGTAAGRKLFRATVSSEKSAVTGFDTGYLVIS